MTTHLTEQENIVKEHLKMPKPLTGINIDPFYNQYGLEETKN